VPDLYLFYLTLQDLMLLTQTHNISHKIQVP